MCLGKLIGNNKMTELPKYQLSDESRLRLRQLAAAFPERKSVVLAALHVIHCQFSYLDGEAIKEAAAVLNLPEVYFEEAASFYTLFPSKVPGKHLIQVCQNISCTLNGAEELIAYLKEKLGIEVGGTTRDGLFTMLAVECLGSCGTAPVMQIDERYYEHLTRARVDEILERLSNGRQV